MIRALCLNPTFDRNYFIPNYQPGAQHKMLHPVINIGGKGINVARVCNQLNEPVDLYCFAGAHNGDLLIEQITPFCNQVYSVRLHEETRTSINIIDTVSGLETEMMEVGPKVLPEQYQELIDKIEKTITAGDYVICSGIVAPGIPDDTYIQISKMCEERNAKCILDTNGINLINSISGSYWMAKPNHLELAELVGMKTTNDPIAIYNAAKTYKDTINNILVSMGKEGAILITDAGAWWAHTPEVHTVSCIGSGDSMVAGFVVSAARGSSLLDCLKYSIACGTANSLTDQCGKLDLSQLDDLLNLIAIERII